MYRIRGTIKFVSRKPLQAKTFAIVLGDDFRDYFFIPSYMELPAHFVGLKELLRVEFEPRARDSSREKLYAWGVSVLSTTETPRAESIQG